MDREGYFFYSAKQEAISLKMIYERPHHPTFCKLDDGQVVQYTF